MGTQDATVIPAANTSQGQVAALVGTGKAVLVVGPGTAGLAEELRGNGCDVSLADDEPDVRTSAFDAVVHTSLPGLADPAAALGRLLPALRPGGDVVVTAANVAHGSVRLALLAGAAGESPAAADLLRGGCTRAALLETLQAAGLAPVEVRATVVDPLATGVRLPESLPSAVVEWVRTQPEAFYHRYVVRAQVADRPVAEAPPTVPAAPPRPVRDRHTERVERERAELADLKHRLLTLRDHVIGLESTAAKARADADRARHEAQRQLDEVRASTTWRAGRLAVGPVSWVRHRLGGNP